MSYIICNGDNYLRQNKKSQLKIVKDINQATRWDTAIKANNVCDNISRNKNFKDYNLHVKSIFNDDEIISIDNYKPIELNYNILDKVKEMYTFTRELEQRKMYLVEQLSKIDMEIVDIEHAAEFYNLNASQGYKLYKLLHDRRIERRKIKDELQVINLTLGTSINSNNMNNLEKSILGMDNRIYTPRINKELFGV